MKLALALTIAQSAIAGVTVSPALPRPVEAAIATYQQCLFEKIDEQTRGRVEALSEREVISRCARVRGAEFDIAVAGLSAAGWSDEASRRRVDRRFAELDESVWTIVDHFRARHAGR